MNLKHVLQNTITVYRPLTPPPPKKNHRKEIKSKLSPGFPHITPLKKKQVLYPCMGTNTVIARTLRSTQKIYKRDKTGFNGENSACA